MWRDERMKTKEGNKGRKMTEKTQKKDRVCRREGGRKGAREWRKYTR